MDKKGSRYGNKYSLTYPQKNIWLVDKFYGNTSINVIAGIIEVQRGFDIEVCKKAINIMLKANDGLRLRVTEENGEPVQYVSEYKEIDVDVFDMNGKTQKELKKLDDKLTDIPFEIIDSPLYYFAIVKESDDKGYMFVKLHHLVSDAWTFGKIGTTLANLVDSMENRTEIEEDKPSYTEYIEAEKEYIASEKFEKDKLFWETYLDGVTESVGLKEESNQNSIKAKRYTLRLDKKLNKKIREYCTENKVSPYTVFMNALAIYIHRVTEKTDFVIGTPVLNRANFNEKQMMGMFVSTMPVRFKIDEKVNFLDMCKNTSRETMSLFRHQKYPYSLSLENFRKKNGLKDNIYKTMISYQNARAIYEDSTKYSSRWNFSNEAEDDFAMHITDMDETGVFEIHFDYKKETFEDIEIKYIASRIFAIIEDGIDNNKKVEDIEIMTKEEKNKILYEFNDTKRDYPKDKTVIDLFEEQVNKTPDNIALVFEGKEVTYKELNERANSLAKMLKSKSINESDRVAVFLDKSIELIISILAVLKTGACYVPIDYAYSIDRKKYILEDAEVKLAIVSNSQDAELIENNIIITENNTSNTLSENILRNNKYTYDSLVYIMYTSGTTGKPKGAMITNRNIVRLVKNTNYIEFKENDRIIQTGATVFDACTFEYWGALLNGLTLCMISKEKLINPEILYKFIRENKVTIMFITTALFNLMIDYDESIFSTLRILLTGGEVMSLRHVNRAIKASPNVSISNIYGPTENTTFSSFCKLYNKQNNRVPIGIPINNSTCYIIDSKNRLMPIFVEGELATGGDGVCKGYLNNTQMTNDKFIPRIFDNDIVYKTGDICRWLNNGNVDYVGRRDNQVKIRGFRIELDEIKKKILEYGNITDCAVLVTEDSGNKRIICYYTSTKSEDNKSIFEYLQGSLPNYMVPDGYIQINKIPLNINGKTDIKKLPNIPKYNTDNRLINRKDISDEEYLIAKIFSEILEYNEVIIYSYLKNYNIDSLKAILVVMKINEKFNSNISLKDIYESYTLSELYSKITDKHKDNDIGKVNKSCNNELVELSTQQKGIFNEYILNSNSTIYNIPFEIKLEKIDIVRLKNAIIDAINNSVTMNAKIIFKDSKIYQIKGNPLDEINIISLTDLQYKKEKEVFSKPFDLIKDKLYKVKIYIVGETTYVLFDIHHIIFDGISLINLLNKIKFYYENEQLKLESYNLNDIYDKVDHEKYIVSREFYLKEFSGELPVNELPLDHDRGLIKSIDGKVITYRLSKQQTKMINEYCDNNGVTLSTFFFSLYNILLSKYSYNDDMIINTVCGTRKKREQIDAIGMLVKTLPVRTKIDYKDNIRDYMLEINQKMINTIENDSYTLQDLLSDLKLKSDRSRSPLTDFMFVYQSMKFPNIHFDGKKVQISNIQRITSKYDITCEIVPINNYIEINFEYCTNLFDRLNVERMQQHYANIIEYVLRNENKKLSDITMIDNSENILVIDKFNDNKTNYPKEKTVHQIFEENVKKYPNKKAVVFENSSLTYDELNKRSNKLARALLSRGVKPGNVVAIMMDKSLEYLISAIAILKCNAGYTPITPELPEKRAKYMMDNANTKIIITNQLFYRKISDIECLFIDSGEWVENSSENLNLINDSNTLFHVIYTSGSTGVPKGNMIKHKGIVRLLLNTNYVEYTENDIMLASASLTFDISGFEIWGAMLYGMTLHMISKKNVMDMIYYSNYIKENNITTTFLATPIFHLMVETNIKIFDSLSSVYVGGETLLPKYTNMLFTRNKSIKIYNAYGPAEITVICCAMLIDKIYERDIPLGKIVSNNNCYILDKCNNICPINVPGELCISGDGMGFGYINRPDLTNERFTCVKCIKEKVYKSGDLTIWNKDGEVRFIGRIDTQVKIRGQRIELTEIENKILSLSGIHEAKVIISLSNENKKYIVAYYTSNENIEENIIKEYLGQYLPDYMIPYRIVKLKVMPLNQNGKIDKNKLPKVDYIEKPKEIKKADNSQQQQILDAYIETLKNENIDMNSDFFEVGGDSLQVARLVMELQNRNIKITYSDVFKHKTPTEIYNFVNKLGNDEDLSKKIKDIDYTSINKLLSVNVINKKKLNLTSKIENVLLVGATGFLGSHIVKELALNGNVENIFCIVRSKDNICAEQRFKDKMKYFFNDNENNVIINRVKVIDFDILNEQLDTLNIKPDLVINAAAYVKHYGNYEKFYNINVEIALKLIEFCAKNNSKLVHISTLSVSGNIIEGGQVIQKNINKGTHYAEKDLYINQSLDNVYVYTKYLAELYVLRSIANGTINGTIMRVGNLTGRYSDGKFQPNVDENAFSNRIKAIIELRNIPQDIMNLYLELTPIDYTAQAIVKLIFLNNKYTVYHIFNDNHLMMNDVFEIFEKIGIKLNVNTEEEFSKLLKRYMEDPQKRDIISGIIPDIDKNGEIHYNDGTIIDSNFTKNILRERDFEWPIVTSEYFIKYLKYLQKIGFINLGGEIINGL